MPKNAKRTPTRKRSSTASSLMGALRFELRTSPLSGVRLSQLSDADGMYSATNENHSNHCRRGVNHPVPRVSVGSPDGASERCPRRRGIVPRKPADSPPRPPSRIREPEAQNLLQSVHRELQFDATVGQVDPLL